MAGAGAADSAALIEWTATTLSSIHISQLEPLAAAAMAAATLR